MSRITEALAALADGSKTIDQVEADLADYEWPRRRSTRPETADDLFAATISDPEPVEEEGTFAEVEDAYMASRIDQATYARLHALASINRAPQ